MIAMYLWIVFLHVLSAFLFMLAHGATAAVMFAMQSERSPERLKVLLAVRDRAQMPFTITSTVMFLSGIALGFMGGFWGRIWIWAALVLLVVISVFMGFLGRNRLDKIKSLVDSKTAAVDLETAITAANPMLLSIVGIGGFILILWLMMFKPF